MRILIFHGYLLRGTGSNVYNARLAGALARAGHEVHLLCQERRPEEVDVVDAAGDWDSGVLQVRSLRSERAGAGSVTVYRPDIGGVLPVYVADRYEGVQARTFAELSDDEVAEYVARNVAAVQEVAALVSPELALANHMVMGPLVLARALGDTVPYAVKIHGSALEYMVKPQPERFMDAAREGLARAQTILVGSRHTAESLWAAMEDPSVRERTRLGPPGVDVEAFRRHAPQDLAGVAARLAALPATAAADDAFARDTAAAGRALATIDPARDRIVTYVGKLIVSKGVDLLIAAWPLVLAKVPDAKLAIVGFGGYRATLEELVAALARGDVDAVRAIAAAGRAPEGGPAKPLAHLTAFLDTIDASYLAAARALPERVVFTGRLEHDELPPLLGVAEAQVVPSTFPEAFGMVAVEAAACGALPVVADQSGLGEVRTILAGVVPEEAASWLGFPLGDGTVEAIAARLIAWLTAPEATRQATRDALVSVARERFSWDGVAQTMVRAALGDAADLPRP
ncbi:glycosyltransferase family 4 protein [Baekduia sp. Peel2402]|uniref:glycosyltransferase family 4 protein n=1 Tax=Baekduia sp. Peel2402 TaxID=3458296 RepID=UPI00403EC976